MPDKKPTCVFIHRSVDGVGVCLLLKWLYGDKINIIETVHSNARALLLEWLRNEHIKDHKGVWFVGLDCHDIKDLADTPETRILTKTSFAYDFQYAEVTSSDGLTLTEMIYESNKDKLNLSDPKRLLIKLLIDNASNARKFSRSANLALLFHALKDNPIERFYDAFKDGLREFNDNEMSLIKWHRKRVSSEVSGLNPHRGAIDSYTAIVGFAKGYYSEVATHVFNKYTEEIAIFVNLKANIVIFRRRNNSSVDVLEVANKFCIAKGNPWACVGNLSDNMMELMKGFSPIQ